MIDSRGGAISKLRERNQSISVHHVPTSKPKPGHKSNNSLSLSKSLSSTLLSNYSPAKTSAYFPVTNDPFSFFFFMCKISWVSALSKLKKKIVIINEDSCRGGMSSSSYRFLADFQSPTFVFCTVRALSKADGRFSISPWYQWSIFHAFTITLIVWKTAKLNPSLGIPMFLGVRYT